MMKYMENLPRKGLILLFVVLCHMGPGQIFAQPTVSFSVQSGFYDKPFPLALTMPEAAEGQEYVIRYTLNGSQPQKSSPAYSQPIMLDERSFSPSNIYRIQNAPDELWHCPERVDRIVVVRAAVFGKSGERCSEVATASYVITSLLGRSISLPVVSLCVDSADLFDYQHGIFVPGASFDPADIEKTGNYYRSGKASERMAHFEFMDGDDLVAQDCGLRTHGNISRRYAQKGMSLYARQSYGKKNFKGIWLGSKDKRLVLRPFSSAWTPAGFQNYFCQMLASSVNLHFDNLACKPVAVFLNGEYWGIYFLEQKPDEKYVAKKQGVDSKSVRLVEDWAGHDDDGIDSGFVELMQWVAATDFSDNQAYEELSQRIDIESFVDYVVFETFIGNRDWPANNMRCWSVDGSPWRFIFFDGDAIRTTRFDAVGNAMSCDSSVSWPASPESTLLLRKLLVNKRFRHKFRTRMNELCENHFQWSVFGVGECLSPLFGVVVNDLEREISAQSARFSYPKGVRAWKANVRQLRRYFKRRAAVVQREWERRLDELDGRPSSMGIPIILSALLALIALSTIAVRRCRRRLRGR